MTTTPLRIPYPIIVEGKYDRERILSIADADVYTTDGFGIFKNSELESFIRLLAGKTPVIIMTDSDGAGLVIRNHFNSLLPRDRIIHLYIPRCPGKEKRKSVPSKEGLLGVEGTDRELLRQLLAPYASGYGPARCGLTKTDFYNDGLSGLPGSAALRIRLAELAGLPSNISANALLEALNLLFTKEQYRGLLERAAADTDRPKDTK